MIYNEHTISIETFSLVYKTNDFAHLSTNKLYPKRLLKRKFHRIVDFFNVMIAGDDDQDEKMQFLKLKMRNMINNLLPNLYNGLLVKPTQEMGEWFKSYFGKDIETKEDLKLILLEREKQLKMFNQLFPEIDVQEQDEPFDFDQFVSGLEISTGNTINRRDKLYTLGSHYKNAVKLNKQREKMMRNA